MLGAIVSPVHDAYSKEGLVAATHRTAMLRLALRSSDWVRLSDWECSVQTQWTRTRQTLQYHQNFVNSLVKGFASPDDSAGLPDWVPPQVGNCTEPVQLKLLCGADLLESFAVPGLWQPEDVSVVGQCRRVET